MIVTLSRQDLSLCKQGATLRWQLARLSGVTNQRKDKNRSDQDLDMLGLMAELAVAKVFSIKHSPFQMGVDDGSDMYLGNISIDVKSTFYPTGKLLFKSKASFKSDCAVLACKIAKNQINVVGFIPRSIFLDKAIEINLGHGKGWAIEQNQLMQLGKLWETSVKQTLK